MKVIKTLIKIKSGLKIFFLITLLFTIFGTYILISNYYDVELDLLDTFLLTTSSLYIILEISLLPLTNEVPKT